MGPWGQTEGQLAPDALDPSHQPFLQLLLDLAGFPEGILLVLVGKDSRRPRPREEIDEVDHAILVYVAGLEDA